MAADANRATGFSSSADFTTFPVSRRVVSVADADRSIAVSGCAELPHDERHLRRRALALDSGERIVVDLPKVVALNHGDRLVLEDGRQIEIAAALENLLEIVPQDQLHLAELAWHIGNRHLAAEIRADRILLGRDHVIKAMLEGLGATVNEVVAPFHPLRGAYGGHGHSHGHNHG